MLLQTPTIPVAPQFALHGLQDVQLETAQLTREHALLLLLRLLLQPSDWSTSNNTTTNSSNAVTRIVFEFIPADSCSLKLTSQSATCQLQSKQFGLSCRVTVSYDVDVKACNTSPILFLVSANGKLPFQIPTHHKDFLLNRLFEFLWYSVAREVEIFLRGKINLSKQPSKSVPEPARFFTRNLD